MFCVRNFFKLKRMFCGCFDGTENSAALSRRALWNKKAVLSRSETARCRCNFPRWRSAAILGLIEPEISSFDPPTMKTIAWTKHEVDRMTHCGDMTIRNSISRGVRSRPQFCSEGGGHRGRRSYYWKERCWFPIVSPLWPLRYLWPFSHNLPSNVCDAQFDRGWVTLGQNFRVFPLEQIPDVEVCRERTPQD